MSLRPLPADPVACWAYTGDRYAFSTHDGGFHVDITGGPTTVTLMRYGAEVCEIVRQRLAAVKGCPWITPTGWSWIGNSEVGWSLANGFSVTISADTPWEDCTVQALRRLVRRRNGLGPAEWELPEGWTWEERPGGRPVARRHAGDEPSRLVDPTITQGITFADVYAIVKARQAAESPSTAGRSLRDLAVGALAAANPDRTPWRCQAFADLADAVGFVTGSERLEIAELDAARNPRTGQVTIHARGVTLNHDQAVRLGKWISRAPGKVGR